MADNPVVLAGTNSLVAPDSHFGLFNWLDHRSAYYRDFFPQPLLVEDTGLEEDGELSFNAFAAPEANRQRNDIITAGVQKSFLAC